MPGAIGKFIRAGGLGNRVADRHFGRLVKGEQRRRGVPLSQQRGVARQPKNANEER